MKLIKKLVDPDHYTKGRLVGIFLTTILLLFSQEATNQYDSFIILPLLSKIKQSNYNDTIFIFISLVIIFLFISKTKNKYQFSLLQITLTIIIATIYLSAIFKRNEEGSRLWHFENFTFSNNLRYADIIILYCICLLSTLLYNKFTTKKVINNNSHFSEDNPISTQVDDTLNRKILAKQLAQQINSLKTRSSFAIGIIGPWGIGKTSFINIVKTELSKENIVIDFNPWLVESTLAIRKDFFNTLKENLKKYSGDIYNDLSVYSNSLSEVYDNTATKAVKQLASLFIENPTLTEQFEKINKVITSINKRIIVIIDDIDRLDKDEVIETLRLVRNTASFNNTIFILAYDKQYVTSAINTIVYSGSQQFLEKIVQLEISLPKPDRSTLQNKSISIIKNATEEKYHKIISDAITGKTENRLPDITNLFSRKVRKNNSISFYNEFITHLRDATRFANAFTFDYLPLAGNIKENELIHITLIKLKFPLIYNLLKSKKILKEDFNINNISSEGFITIDKEKLESHFTEHPYTSDEKELIRRILNHEFADIEIDKNERTVQRPSSFDIYFSGGSFSNVPYIEIDELRTSTTNNIQEYIIKWQSKNQLYEAFEILSNIEIFNNKLDFKNVCVFIFKSGKILDISILNWIKNINNNKDKYIATLFDNNKEELRSIFLTQFAKATEPYIYESDLAFNIKAELWRNNIEEFFIEKNQLDNITNKYLELYIEKHEKIDNTTIALYRNNGSDVNEENYIIVNSKANFTMCQAIQNDKEGFADLMIIPDRYPADGIHFTFLPFLEQIFGSHNHVQEFINTLPINTKTELIKLSYQLYKQNNYSYFTQPNINNE